MSPPRYVSIVLGVKAFVVCVCASLRAQSFYKKKHNRLYCVVYTRLFMHAKVSKLHSLAGANRFPISVCIQKCARGVFVCVYAATVGQQNINLVTTYTHLHIHM